jgi:hypothetical protein
VPVWFLRDGSDERGHRAPDAAGWLAHLMQLAGSFIHSGASKTACAERLAEVERGGKMLILALRGAE